jgi:glutamate synthase (NADPH/NADH) small chain
MGNPKGFIEISRIESGYRPIEERVADYNEVELMLPENERKRQASRCMDCGIPFCHWACPVENVMPEWQHKLSVGDWKAAYDILQSTNNFPEFTGRVCPAPCEVSCVLSINDKPVTIRENELAVIERAFAEGYVKPNPPSVRTGKKVAVIGSGPAGLACADILNKIGHTVVLYEADEAVGGYLRYGIPDFKLDKKVIDRRVNLLVEEGLIIKTGVMVGRDVTVGELKAEFDAICVTIGARKPRDLPIKGRDLNGIHFALDFLGQQNRVVDGKQVPADDRITALNKHVVVLGGGDTGSDCVGTANRQGAKTITQLEILPKPPDTRPDDQPWPIWAKVHKTSSSHEEGCTRFYNISTNEFIGEDGAVKALSTVRVDWKVNGSGRYKMEECADSEAMFEADLVLLALGFVHPVHDGLVNDLGVERDARGNLAIDSNFMTSVPGVFAAGDSSRGASLVVWAIHEGREAARGINAYLME